MNDLTPSVASNRQEYFTAAELADIAKQRGLASFPATERGVRVLAEREGWNELTARSARPRSTEGRGRPAMEYHFSILPEAIQRTIAGAAMKVASIQRFEREVDLGQRRLAALKSSQLPARARTVMDARAEVLISIEGYAVSRGQSRAWGIIQFIDAQ